MPLEDSASARETKESDNIHYAVDRMGFMCISVYTSVFSIIPDIKFCLWIYV